MRNKVTYLLIIGAMKCGTSSLFEYLKGHPEICPSKEKEPEYFSEHQKHGSGEENYDDLWPDFDSKQHTVKLEASTGYTKYPMEKNVARKISESRINVSFIYIVRNPYDRITSHINFLENVDKQLKDGKNSQLLNTTKYYTQLDKFRRYFKKEDILVVDFDDLKTNPRSILDKIYAFLEMENTCYPEHYEVVNASSPESDLEVKIRTSKLKSLLKFVPIKIRNCIKHSIRKVVPRKKRLLTEKEEEFIKNELMDDMKKLEEEYSIDVGKWGFIESPLKKA